MVAFEQIKQFCDQVVREFKPEKIILFGSHAYGTPSEDSDVDLMVVMPYEGNSLDKVVEILHRTHPRFALDLQVRSKPEIQRRLEWHDFFLMDVMEKGKILYDADHH